MIKIYSQSTHSKFIFDNKNCKGYDLVLKSFIAKDTSLENDPRVKRGYMSPYENFYIIEEDILPTGLLPYLFKIYENNNIKYEHIDLRKFPGVDKEFLRKLINDEITFTTNDRTIIKPSDRPYQKESALKVIKERGGIINLPTASGKCLGYDEILELQVDDNLYNKLKELNFLEDC